MADALWFPRTKLQPPLPSGETLARPRLLEPLYHAVTGQRLTLLSAPAGSGKTTALAGLCQAYPCLRLAWITLDSADNDPTLFFHLLLAALEELEPAATANTRPLLLAFPEQPEQWQRLVGVLINDIIACEPAPFLLALDDLHLITSATLHQALDYLIERMPPAMHVAVTTRQDPPLSLARLRARGELAEFRMGDLRFTEDESSRLLNGLLNLDLPEEDLRRLQQRVEGWGAGLRLLSLSLKRLPPEQRSHFIDQLAQGHRFIFDYLVEEVLQQQEVKMREFLLQTSILTELTPAMCAAVTGREDAATVLDRLFRRNLFLQMREGTPGEGGPGYRYHALFARFLQQQLAREMPGRAPDLHQRAAEATSLTSLKVHHYLAAEAWEEAAEVIEQEGKRQAENVYVRTQVADWVRALPASQRARPWLQMVLGGEAVVKGYIEAAAPPLERALAAFRAGGDRYGELFCLLTLNSRYGGAGDLDAMEELIRQFEAEPSLVPATWLVQAHGAAAWIHQYRQQWDRVEAHILPLLAIISTSDDIRVRMPAAQGIAPHFLFTDSGPEPVERYAEETLTRFGSSNPVIELGARVQLAGVRFYQGQLDIACDHARRAQQLSNRLGGMAWMDMVPDHVLLFTMLIRGQYTALHDYLDERLPQLARVDTLSTMTPAYLYLRGRALWLQDRHHEIPPLLAEMEPWDFMAEHHLVRHHLRGLLALAERRFQESEAALLESAKIQRATRHTALCTLARLDLALLYRRWGKPEQARLELADALAEAQRRRLPAIVLQSGRAVIPLLQDAVRYGIQSDLARASLKRLEAPPAAIPLPGANESLTPREVEVLHLLVRGASNREIADDLVITPRTVKSHVTSILAKLNATSRAQAAARARDLGLW